MDMTPKEYQDYVAKKAKKSPIVKDTILAFLIGGAICTLGQGSTALWAAGLDKEAAGTATSVSLVFLSVLLTGLNLYNKIGRFGGAGTLVPIVTGMAAKMFVVAGPVIVFGTVASVVYGVIYWITTLL